MRIALLGTARHFRIGCGVYTFAIELSELLFRLGHRVDYVLGGVEDPSALPGRVYRDPIAKPNAMLDLVESTQRALGKYLTQQRPDLIIANDFPAAEVLIRVSEIPGVYYTHRSEEFTDNTELYETFAGTVLDHRRRLRDSNIQIATQTPYSVRYLTELYGADRVNYLPMPCRSVYSMGEGDALLVVGSDTFRKRLDFTLALANAAGIPVKLISTTHPDGIKILEKGPKTLSDAFRGCRAGICLSSAEVMPYAILEACDAMPWFVDSSFDWNSELPVTVYRDKPNIENLKRFYREATHLPRTDLGIYNTEVERYWVNYFERL